MWRFVLAQIEVEIVSMAESLQNRQDSYTHPRPHLLMGWLGMAILPFANLSLAIPRQFRLSWYIGLLLTRLGKKLSKYRDFKQILKFRVSHPSFPNQGPKLACERVNRLYIRFLVKFNLDR